MSPAARKSLAYDDLYYRLLPFISLWTLIVPIQ